MVKLTSLKAGDKLLFDDPVSGYGGPVEIILIGYNFHTNTWVAYCKLWSLEIGHITDEELENYCIRKE